MLSSSCLRALLASQGIQFEPEIFEETDELRSLLLDSLQRIKANGIGRDELIELQDGIGGFRARCEKLWNLHLTQVTRQVHYHTPVLAPQLYPAPHRFSSGQQALYRAIRGQFAMNDNDAHR